MNTELPPVIDSLAGFRSAVVWGVNKAVAQGARRIVCVDAEFVLWPWDDAELLQVLSTWLRHPQRRLEFLARDYEEMPRRFPRFMTWRRDWTHAVNYWQAPEELAAALPCVLVSDGAVSVKLLTANIGVAAQRWIRVPPICNAKKLM